MNSDHRPSAVNFPPSIRLWSRYVGMYDGRARLTATTLVVIRGVRPLS